MNEVVLLVPILRAGLGMVQAIQEIVPLTEVAHVGLRRDEATLQSEVYLNRLPRTSTGRRVMVCDPMLATGGSLGQVCGLVRERARSRSLRCASWLPSRAWPPSVASIRVCASTAPPWIRS